jgi:hypothetical protein
MRILRFVVLLAVPAVLASPLAGQLPDTHREAQLKMVELQRSMLLAMADSMPERLYRDRATPEQRDFAQQIGHAAGGAARIAARFVGGGRRPQPPDTATALNSREGLERMINQAYDYVADLLREETDEERAQTVQFFGQEIPRWQVWDEIHQHTIWTAGQVVANFRKHGMAPPGFGFF